MVAKQISVKKFNSIKLVYFINNHRKNMDEKIIYKLSLLPRRKKASKINVYI